MGLVLAPTIGAGGARAAITPAVSSWQKMVNYNGECMEASNNWVKNGDSNINGAPVRQWNCVGGDTQQWFRGGPLTVRPS